MPVVDVPLPAFAALISSFLWAATSVYTFSTVKEIGPALFNSYRVLIGFVALWVLTIAMGQVPALGWRAVLLIMGSGVLGVYLGNILSYATLVRLGPRRTVVFMAMSSPIVIVFGAIVLSEVLSPQAYAGVFLILVAVLVMGLFDVKKDQHAQNRYPTRRKTPSFRAGRNAKAAFSRFLR